jgi:hypothetical protein
MYFMVHLLVCEMLIIVVIEQAFPLLSLIDPPESEQPSSNKRYSIRGDNDLCDPDNSSASLAPYVQLARLPRKSRPLFR